MARWGLAGKRPCTPASVLGMAETQAASTPSPAMSAPSAILVTLIPNTNPAAAQTNGGIWEAAKVHAPFWENSAPRQYGWDANEGAPSPAAPQVYNRGEFNPQTYGWDHNEGAPVFGGQEDIDWYLGGSQGERPSRSCATRRHWQRRRAWPAAVPQTSTPDPVAGRCSPYPLGTPDWYNDRRPGGSEDQSWVQGGSQGSRPSSGQAGRDADIAWYLGGSQGPRPSANTDFSARSRNEPSFLGQYDWATSFGNRDPGTATALRDRGAGSPRAYDPQLDWLSSGIPQQPSATRDQITQAIADRYSQVGGASPNTFGAPSSGYLGSQGRLNQDPFGGYVNPRDLDAGGSFPADYAPRFNAYGNAFNQ